MTTVALFVIFTAFYYLVWHVARPNIPRGVLLTEGAVFSLIVLLAWALIEWATP